MAFTGYLELHYNSIYNSRGNKYREYEKADDMIETIKDDEFCMFALQGEKEVIYTGIRWCNWMYNVPHKVLLPAWIFEQANEMRCLVVDYMKRYPNYRNIKISRSFAVCEREQAFLGGSYAERSLKIRDIHHWTGIPMIILRNLYYRRSNSIKINDLKARCKVLNCDCRRHSTIRSGGLIRLNYVG